MKKLFLEKNGLKDDGLAAIFRGLKKQKLKVMSLINNEVGPQSLKLLQEFLPHLTYLRLIDMKGTSNLLTLTIPNLI